MGRKSIRRILEWMCCGYDFHFAVGTQLFDKPVDQPRIDQRFVALDINYVRELLCFTRHFSDSIRAAEMSGRSQRDLCTPIKRRGGDSHIVSRNDNQIQAFGAEAALENSFQKWLPINRIQWFSRKSRRTPPGGNNSNRFTHVRDR